MINLNQLNQYRVTTNQVRKLYGSVGDSRNGVFVLKSPIDKAPLKIIAACDSEWEHVSVSRKNRCPNWPEMEFIKRTFFSENEIAMQLHVEEKEHINVHPYCLHIWKPLKEKIPLPPSIFVG